MSEQHDEHEPAGLPDAEDVSEEETARLDRERAERLDDDNRPDGAEVDNTDRTFDDEAGMFTDSPDYDEEDRPYQKSDDEA